ncbi:Phosphatidylinositol transfer protein [Dirofilaria immitis]
MGFVAPINIVQIKGAEMNMLQNQELFEIQQNSRERGQMMKKTIYNHNYGHDLADRETLISFVKDCIEAHLLFYIEQIRARHCFFHKPYLTQCILCHVDLQAVHKCIVEITIQNVMFVLFAKDFRQGLPSNVLASALSETWP